MSQAIYEYDSVGRLESVTFDSGAKITYSYDPVGNRTSVVAQPAVVTSSGVLNGFRFSLSSTQPVPSSDITGATSGYLVPYTSDEITLLNSSGSLFTNSSDGASLSLSFSGFTAGTVHRIFASDPTASGTTTLSAVAWSSTSSPGSSLALAPAAPGGFLVQQSTPTNRYIADIYCSATGEVSDAVAQRDVFNNENRVLRRAAASDTTASWSVGSGVTGARDNNTTNGVGRFTLMVGQALDAIVLSMDGNVATLGRGATYQFGFGVNSTSAFTRSRYMQQDDGFNGSWIYQPAVGWSYIQAMEGAISASVTLSGNSPEAVLEAFVRM
jgi:YD repeat-containing protein